MRDEEITVLTREELLNIFFLQSRWVPKVVHDRAQEVILNPERYPRCSVIFAPGHNPDRAGVWGLKKRHLPFSVDEIKTFGHIDFNPDAPEVGGCLNDPVTLTRVFEFMETFDYHPNNIRGTTQEHCADWYGDLFEA